MLDENEWPEVSAALTQGLRNIQAARAATGASLAEVMAGARPQGHYAEALDLYERITGYRETNPLAIWHHRASIYGPPCSSCGTPLRTPEASLCVACGARRAT